MGLVYSRRGGIVTVEQASDFNSVERALKSFDRELVLNVEYDETYRMAVYDVHKVVSRDRPAVFVCAWRSPDGMPLPLSHALVDMVKELHPSSRKHRAGLDTGQAADRRNAEIVAERRAETHDGVFEITRDMLPRIRGTRIPVLHRGLHLARARGRTGRLR